jgi:broad specificity phosphatase PhoE
VLEAFAARVGEYPFPGGEDVPQLLARVWPAFEGIAVAHAGHAVAVVAHAGANRAILCRALGLPLARLLVFGQDYAALSVLEHADGGWRLLRLNESPAL